MFVSISFLYVFPPFYVWITKYLKIYILHHRSLHRLKYSFVIEHLSNTHSEMEKTNLFVEEEEEASDSPAFDQYEDSRDQQVVEEDDPIILTIPILHGGLPNRQSQTIHVLQYAGRPKSRPFSTEQLNATVKPHSKVVELKVPMDTLKFYDEARAEELGTRVEALSLLGVLTNTDGGLYVGMVVEKEGNSRIVLIPLDSTGQLRPLFKYIDDMDSARSAQIKQEASTADPVKPSAVLVLQTASKTGQFNAEGAALSTIGSCLRHIKQFNEENWETLSWRNVEDSSTAALKVTLESPNVEPVVTSTLFDEFA